MPKKNRATRRARNRRAGSRSVGITRRRVLALESLEPRHLLASNPIISEILASNQEGLTDMFGVASDWVEIYNPDSADAVDLTGWKLRYKSGTSAVDWSFPSMTLGPGEYRVIFASGRNLIDPNNELHANFNLSKDGQRLRLLHGTEVIQDFNDYPELQEDVSYGIGQEVTETTILDSAALTKYYVPSDDSLGTSWTQQSFVDSGWTSGVTGLGFAEQTDGFSVTGYKASGVSTIATLAAAQALVDGTAGVTWSESEISPSLNYRGTGAAGHFIYDTAFPGLRVGVTQYNYVVQSSGTIHISAPETWTFGISSDDGFRLAITDSATGAAVPFTAVYGQGTLLNGGIQYEGVRTATDTFGTVTFATAGDYDLNVLYYQGTTTCELELFAAEGNFTTYAGTSAWRLVGDTANGGLAVSSPPLTGADQSIAGLVKSDVSAALQAAAQQTSIYTRTAFDCADLATLTSLTLKMAYDDGYVAYVNGVEVARRNVPTTVTWDSQALGTRSSELQSSTFETVDITWLIGDEILQTSGNVLAVQVLQASASDGDLLMLPEIAQISSTQLGEHFFGTPSPAAPNAQSNWEQADDPEFSVEHGFYDDPFALTLSNDTANSLIYYTLDSSAPWNANTATALPYQIARSSQTATVTLTNHGYVNGDVIQVTAATQPEYNGVYTIFNVTTNTFSYTMTGAPVSPSTGSPTVLKVDQAVTSITRSDTTATVTIPNHGLETNDLVRILGASTASAAYNGDFVVAVVDSNTFTYTVSSAAPATASGALAAFKLGTLYTAPIAITTTATVRARAYNSAFEPSDVVTQTYIYLDDVINQPADPDGYPTNWNTVPADYEMDPRITEDPAYATLLRDALTALPTLSLVSDRSLMFDANLGVLASAASLGGDNSLQPPTVMVSVEYFDPNGDEEGFQVNAGVSVYGNAGRGVAFKKHGLRLRFKEEYGVSELEYPIFGEDAADEFDSLVLRVSYGDMWTTGGSTAQYVKDAYAALTQLALEQPSRHAQFVHVYIDGLYWGLFDMAERPDDSFAAEYFGGDKDDYEASNSGYDNLAPKIQNIPYWNEMLADTKVGFNTTTSQAGVAGFNTTLYAAGASSTPGFTSITYKANVNVTSLGGAEAVILNPSQQTSTATATASTVNYLNTGADGRFLSGNNYFPGQAGIDVDNFVVETTSSVTIPTSGNWTFGVSSNESFKLTLFNGVDTYTFSVDGTRSSPADTLKTFNITTAGAYRMRLVYFEYTGGAELELYAAQGSYTAWTSTTNWRLVGDTAAGGLASYIVTAVNTLAQAESLISTTADQAWVKTQTPATINYLTAGTAYGHYPATNSSFQNMVFPGTTSGTPMQSFVVKVESTISIPSTGKWTFGVTSDDGFRLTLLNGTTTVLDSYYDGVRTSAADTLKTATLTAGSYTLRLVYFQSTTAGAELELYSIKNEYSTWGAGVLTMWQPIGGNVYAAAATVTNTGLLSLAAPLSVSNLTDAENTIIPVYKPVSSLWPTKSSVAGIVCAGTTATVTLAGHGFVAGQAVLITGAEQSQYNGTFVITSVTGDAFTYTITGTPASPATGDLYVQPYGMSRSGAGAIVYSPSHGYAVGDYVRVTGATQTDYNGTFRITAVTAHTFTFGLAGLPASPATGASIMVNKVYQAWTYTTTSTMLNYLSTGSDGHFAGSAAFPGVATTGVLLENFAVESKTTISIPAAGKWTFGVSSDEGFSLTLTDGTNTFYAEHNSLRTAGDTFSTFEIPAAGMYRVRLVYFQKMAGAELELYSAAGEWAAWGDTTAWRLVGDIGGIGTSLSNLAMVTTYKANASVTTLDEAELVIQDEARQTSATTQYRNMINFTTGDDEDHFAGSVSFPGIDSTSTDDFVVLVQGTVAIPTAGAWEFSVGCDDGFSLTFYDEATAMSPVMERSALGDWTDSVEIFNFSRTGNFNFQLIYYQHTGDAGLELSATQQPAAKAISGIGAATSVPNRSVSSINRVGTTATVTCNSHGFANGDSIVIGGASASEYNGTFTIANVTAETFTYTISDSAPASAEGPLTAARLVTGISRSNTTATVLCANHGFASGDVVLIAGANESDFNGTFVVTVLDSGTFTYTVASTAAAATTGTVTASSAGITRSGSTATVTLHNHGLSAGQIVLISGADQSAYNGYVSILSVTSNTFTYAVNGAPVSPATGVIAVQNATVSGTSLVSNPKNVSSLNTTYAVPSRNVISITRSGTTVTVTSNSHGLSSGNSIRITGADQTEYNGTYAISNVGTNSFTYTIVSSSVASPATGTIAIAKAVASVTRSGNVATVTLNGHGFSNGSVIFIAGANESDYNGAFVISDVQSNTFTYTVPVTAAASATGTISAVQSGITRSGTTATVNLVNHGFGDGQTVLIAGAAQAEYNGYFQISVLNTNAFTYTVSGTPVSPATGTFTVRGSDRGTAVVVPTRTPISITRTGTTATAILNNHGLVAGNTVRISGADQNDYNNSFPIVAVTTHTFTFTVPATVVTPATGTISVAKSVASGAIARSGTTATVTLAGHGYANGSTVLITGADQSEYNGAFSIFNVTADTFSCTVSGEPLSPATGAAIAASYAGITRSGSTATVNLVNHGFVDGQSVAIGGAQQSAYNGTFAITWVNANTFTYTVAGEPLSPATGAITAQTASLATRSTVTSQKNVSATGAKIVSSITRSSTTATATSTAHGFSTGDTVVISGATPALYNGTFTITYLDSNRFTYIVASSTLTSPAVGTMAATKVGTISRVGTTATMAMTNHGFVNGQTVLISGATQPGYNGYFTINYLTAGTFSFTVSDTLPSPATGSISATSSVATKTTVTSVKNVGGLGTAITLNSSKSVSQISRAGTTATVICNSHGFPTNATVLISGASPSGYNGLVTITNTGTNTFTYTVADTLTTPATGTITAAAAVTRSGGTVTVNYTNHGFVNGQTVLIAGATQTEYNGYFPITYVSANTFTYAIATTPSSPATGSVTARAASVATKSTLTTLTRTGVVATATLASHGYVNGQSVLISGASSPLFNGLFSIYNVTTSTFSYTVDSAAAGSATGASSQPYGISRNGSTVIVSVPSHGFVNGDLVYIGGADQSDYNGTYVISNVTTNSFTYTIATTPASPATGTITTQLARVVRSGLVTTVTLASHGYVNGQTILVSGAAQSQYNGAYVISGVTTNTFDYVLSSEPAGTVATGTVYTQPYGLCRSGQTVIASVASHGFSTGQLVCISGAEQPEYNGTYLITVLNGNTFTYTITGEPASPASGTVTAVLARVTRNGATVTVNLPSHGYLSGQTILISGATQPEYNGTFSIFNVTTHTFDYAISSTPASPALGTIYTQPYGLCRSGSTAIMSLPSHGYVVGDVIRISGASQSEYNGVFTILGITSSTFTFAIADTPTSPATGTILVTKGGLVCDSSTATATLMNHGFVEGQSVFLSGAAQPEYNGSFTIFNVTPNTFSYTVTGTPVSPATGTVYVQQPYGITRSGSTVIVSLAAHGFAAGDTVRISGADQAEYNGTFTIDSASINAFTYTISGTPVSPATGSTINAVSLAFNLSTFRLVGDTVNGGLGVGSLVSVEDMYYYLQGLNPDGTRNPSYAVLIDMDNYIDYLLTTFYVGNGDWPTHNFYAARLNTDESTGYKFFSWDNDASLGLTSDMTKAYAMVAQPYYYLCGSVEFRMRFADHAQKFLYNGGALTPEAAGARYQALIDQIWVAMIAESARWGDIPTSPGPLPHKVEEWRTTVSGVVTSYFPYRTSYLITQLRNNGLLSSVDAPSFYVNGVSEYGGTFEPGDSLTMSAAETIYYCTDGTDPRLGGGAVNPNALTYQETLTLTEATLVKARALRADGTWSALADVVFYPDLTTAIRVTELMYNPAEPSAEEFAAGFIDADEFEFIEIKNTGTDAVSLAGMYLSGGVDYAFPDVTINPGQCLVVASNPAAFAMRYADRVASLVDAVTGYTGHLDNAGEKLTLNSTIGSEIQEFEYSDGWYDHTDGEGFSLTVRDTTQDSDQWDKSSGWRASAATGGTPGYEDTLVDPGSVVVNEVFAHTDFPQVDAIEFYNTTDLPVDVSGWFVSDAVDNLRKYQIAAGTLIAAHGYLVLSAAQFNNSSDPGCNQTFLLSEYGEDVYLSSNADGAVGGYREHVDFGATPNGVSIGLHTKRDEGTDFTLLQSVTLGAANSIPYIAPLAINKISYNPAAATEAETLAGYTKDDFEYIELYNRTESTLSLSDFYLGDGASFSFGWNATGNTNELWTLEPGATATWTPSSLAADSYTVRVHYTRLGGDGFDRKLDDSAEYTIMTTTGPVTVIVDQNQPGVSGDDLWVTLGEFTLDNTAWGKLTRGSTDTDNWTIAEELEFEWSGTDVHIDTPTTLDSRAMQSGLTTLAPNSYVLLVSNYAAFDLRYDIAGNNLPVVGEYDGNLNDDGEMLRLYQYGVADPGIVPAYQVDHVNYGDSGDWPGRPDGDGAVLYRVHPAGYGNEPSNWQSSALGIQPGQPAVRLDKSAPSVPGGLSAISSVTPDNQITVSWTAAVDNQSYVDHYLVYRDGLLPEVVTGTTYVDTDVQATTPYSYRVSAVNRDGYESDLCDAVSVSIPGIVSYSTPEGRIEIVFSEPLDPATAELASNYSINGTAPTSVTLTSGNSKVVLTTDEFNSTTLVDAGAEAKVTVPTASLGTGWTSTSYDDQTWTAANTGVGFEPTLASEVEPNGTTATASSAVRNFATSTTSSLYFLGLTGTTEADDWFKLGAMDAGDVLTITGSGSPSSRSTSTDLRLELWRAGSSTLVTFDEDSGPGQDALIARYAITTADTYYVKIARAGSAVTTGTYALNAWLENSGTAPTTGATLIAEVESNNTLATANNAAASWRLARYKSSTAGNIASTGDVDYYSYAFTAGDLVTVNIDSTSTLDAKVTLVDASGTAMGLEDGTSGFSSPYSLDAPLYCYIVPATGTYYVKVETSGSTTGTYNADVYLATSTPPAMFSELLDEDGNIQSQMLGVNATAYIRIPFTVPDLTAFNKLVLQMKYDDGFVAYLNGTEIARRNAPATTVWNSTASTARSDTAATVYESIDVTAFMSALRSGTNVLGIQALNVTASDTDLLVVPRLIGTQVGAQTTVTMSNLETASGNEISSPVQLTFDYVPQGSGTILREYWTGVANGTVADLTSNTNYPQPPTGQSYPTLLEAPYNWADTYGTRMQGYIYPPITGNYTFWIAGEDTCELWLSTDDNPANKQRIAYVGSIITNAYRAWTGSTSQVSVAISLAAGQRYYIEVLQKDINGNDSVSVRWQLPTGAWENADLNTPIPGVRLSPFGPQPDTTAPSTPQNLRAQITANNTAVTLSWDAAYDPDYNVAYYRVYRDGALYAQTADGTTTTYTDTNVSSSVRHRYQVSAVNVSGYQSGTSLPLTVAPLGVSSIGAYTASTVQIVFSEGVERASAETLSNYSIAGVTISAAHLEADGLMVTLSTSTLALNTNYTATINGVKTLAGATAAVNLQQTFRMGGAVLREYWLNVGTGAAVNDLTSNGNYPNSPTGREYRTQSFESPSNWTTSYGERDRAYLVPDVTGTYTFWIASDDASELWLSTTADPSAKTKIAYLNTASGSRNWTYNQAQQRSATVNLVAGQQYYIEALMKQATGNSALAVGWLKPDAPSLPATYPNVSTSLTRSGNVVTATLAGHGFSVGQSIRISGATLSDYNGTFPIASITANTFTYTIGTTPVSPAAGSPLVSPYGITRVGSTTTAIVWKPNHGYSAGEYVAIRGADQSDYNSAFLITSVTANSFTITVPTTAASPATGTMIMSKLEPIAARYLMPYSLINITGPSQTGTVESQGTTDATPALEGTASDGSASVTVCVGGVYYAARNNGNYTWDLLAGAIKTPLADGVYPVSVCITDSLGRLGFDTTTDELIVDTVLPSAQVLATAHGMSSSSIGQVQIVFNEPVTGFGIWDLRFSRPGGSDLLTGGESLVTTDNITWTLSGLPAQTLLEVPYTLTLLGTGSNIEDAGGNEPVNDVSATWTIHITPPNVTVGSVTPTPRNSAVDQIQIVFDEWIDGLDLADLQLTRDGGANLLTGSQTVSTTDHVAWTIGGLGALTDLSGSYVFTLTAAASGIADAAGNLLLSGGATSWTTDTVAPTGALAAVLPSLRNSGIAELAITFSEPVYGFTLDKLALTRDGGANLLTGAQTLNTTDNVHWTLSNLGGLTATQGSYSLTLTSSGVADVVGNGLSSVAGVAWSVDTVAPTASITAVTPNPRDTTVSTLSITVSEAVQGFSLASLSLTVGGGANLLTASQTLNTTDNIHWTLENLSGITGEQGTYTLAISTSGVTDAAGNMLGNNASTSWSMVISDLDADGNGRADALTDGILVLRYLFDPNGSWNFNDALGTGATRTTRDSIRTYLNAGRTLALDADGNGTADALTDGILILRYLFDPTGSWNFNDALGTGATRTTRTSIRDYLDQYNPERSENAAGASSAELLLAGLTSAVETSVEMPLVETQTAETDIESDSSEPAHDAVLAEWTSSADDESSSDLVASTSGLEGESSPAAEESVFGEDLDDWFFQSPGGLI